MWREWPCAVTVGLMLRAAMPSWAVGYSGNIGQEWKIQLQATPVISTLLKEPLFK